MKNIDLRGWNIDVKPQQIMEPNPDGPPGDMRPVEGWAIILQEVIPQTGNTITFAFGRNVRDDVVRKLTGGLVLAGGEFPKL